MQEISSELIAMFKHPAVWICFLYGFYVFGISFRIVREFSDALATIGIKITKEDRKKWRKLFSTALSIVFFTFLFFYAFAVLFRY